MLAQRLLMINRRLTYAQTALQDKPVAFWQLNETSGTVAADSSGNGYNGTYEGGFTLGQAGIPAGGKSVLLNGSTGYVLCPLALSQSDDVTLECWINPNGQSSFHGAFIDVGDGSNGYALGAGDGNLDAAGQNLVGAYENKAWLPSSAAIPSSGFVHCVMTIPSGAASTGAAGTVYLNGVAYSTTSGANGIFAPTGNVYIGTDLSHSTRYWSGLICNVALYTGNLSASRILAHYQAGIA